MLFIQLAGGNLKDLRFFRGTSMPALTAVARPSKAMPEATLISFWEYTPGTLRVQKVKARQAAGKAAGAAPGGDKMEPPLEEPGRVSQRGEYVLVNPRF